MNILKNLAGYDNGPLTEISLNNQDYKTQISFNPSAIIAQSFGASSDKESYNFLLARSIRDARDFFKKDLTAIVQQEIGENLKDLQIPNYEITCKNWGLTKYLDTLEVLKDSKQILDNLSLDDQSVLYLCHPAHAYRVMALGSKLGLNGQPFILRDIIWPKNDLQYFVCSNLNWVSREILVRIHHNLTGRVD